MSKGHLKYVHVVVFFFSARRAAFDCERKAVPVHWSSRHKHLPLTSIMQQLKQLPRGFQRPRSIGAENCLNTPGSQPMRGFIGT